MNLPMQLTLVRRTPITVYRKEQEIRLMERLEVARQPRTLQALPRRRFLKGLGGLTFMSTIGGTSGLVASGCDTAKEILGLVLASILEYATEKLTFALKENIGGPLILENTAGTSVAGLISMGIFAEIGEAITGAMGEYDIPGFTVNKYKWSMPNELDPLEYFAHAESGLNDAQTDWFKIG